MEDIIASVSLLCCFIKHCEIETKIIEPKEKYRDKQKNRYFNETKTAIEILDSRWFTEIVRTEGFSVGDETGGFWRLQACGKDHSERRLKWIYPFEKKGYTLRAKKHE